MGQVLILIISYSLKVFLIRKTFPAYQVVVNENYLIDFLSLIRLDEDPKQNPDIVLIPGDFAELSKPCSP